MIRAAVICIAFASTAAAGSVADSAIASFNAICFKAGQTAAEARARLQGRDGSPLPYALTFWDITLEPAPDAPPQIERRCEVAFDGDHTDAAIAALRAQMATPPVFGFAIALPATHEPLPGTALIEGRELLRGRVAVVHVGLRDGRTFMAVDRLPAGWEDG
ncbi:hypothetical protein KX928_18015 [Roseobacter sp. YSTF-M11]|uniref:Uncharacterized protein n=1 Tax=Roseobacter insulae TaxID=2859783 RepID=A0A9X1FXX1_9RHOB|nr:hypothetical protein [Roseobacter insulae]MBW4709687.1 hypothetical protein [Roseobacter insulae]